MLIDYEDFNDADQLLGDGYADEWRDIQDVLRGMPLHLKASDQAKIQGNANFDPVGTNAFIKNNLVDRDWCSNVAIPTELDYFGTDVDFTKRGLLLEVQFSHYSFLLNNVVRGELFSKSGLTFNSAPIQLVVIVTKDHMLPASNSTLYYQRAVEQLRELAKHSVIDTPMRVVGLKERIGQGVEVRWTEYTGTGRSRTVVTQQKRTCDIDLGRTARSRCTLTVHHS